MTCKGKKKGVVILYKNLFQIALLSSFMKLCNRDKNLNVNLSIVAIAKVPQKSDSSDKRRTEQGVFSKTYNRFILSILQ